MSMRGRQRRKAFEQQQKLDIAQIGYCILSAQFALKCGNAEQAKQFAEYAGIRARKLANYAFATYPELKEEA